MDGFIVRRRAPGTTRRVGLDDMSVRSDFLIDPARTHHRSASSQENSQTITDDMSTVQPLRLAGEATRHARRSSMGVDMTLDDTDIPGKKKPRKGFRIRKPSKRMVKMLAILLLVALIGYGGFFAWKVISNSSKVFNGNPFAALFNQKELKTDQYGRTNVLLFGTSEDDAADGANGNHPGAYLTDSIMIASFSKTDKNAYLLSVPRDLWVDYGQQCFNGYKGKINAYYLCATGQNNDGTPSNEVAGQSALRQMVGSIFGISLQYSVHVDYKVLEQAVDAVGGVTVTIDSRDPRGVLDRNFDWTCRYKCYMVKYPNGPASLDGIHALYLARARGDDNGQATYGFGGGNFDREKYQQKILIALKQKATSAGVLSNPVTVTNLLDSLGNNVRTNIQSDEIKSFISLLQGVNTDQMKQLTLVEPGKMLVTTGMVDGQSVVEPAAGVYDYGDIQHYIKTNISGDKISQENADISVLNSSGVSGQAAKLADKIEAVGIPVGTIDTAPTGINQGSIVIYDQTGGKKPATLAKLKSTVSGAKVVTTGLPSGVTSSSDFVIIVGTNGVN